MRKTQFVWENSWSTFTPAVSKPPDKSMSYTDMTHHLAIPHTPSSKNPKHGPRLDPVHLKQRVELWCLADFFLIPNFALYLEQDLMWEFAGYVEFLNCPEMEEDPRALRVFIQEFEPATCRADSPSSHGSLRIPDPRIYAYYVDPRPQG
jgi:hypothetical protein